MPTDNHSGKQSQYQGEIADLHHEIELLTAELAGIYNSRVWWLMSPIRWGLVLSQRIYQLLRFLFFLVRSGSIVPLLQKSFRILFQKGLPGFWMLVREHFQKHNRPQQKNDSDDQEEWGNSILIAKAKGKYVKRPGILFVSHEGSRTGAPTFLLDLIRFLSDKLDMEFYILFCRGGELVSNFQAFGTVVVLPTYNRIPAQIMQILNKSNIELIYSNTITNGSIQSQLKRLGAPILCHIHELAFSIENYFGDDNLARIKDTTTYFLAGSKAVRNYLINKVNIPSERVEIAYPFVKTIKTHQEFNNNPPLEFEPGTIIIGACGTISWRKGPDLFLQVARLVLKQVEGPVVFVWVGGPLDGDYVELRHDAAQVGIDKQVIFTGTVRDHLQYFSQFDIFVLPSREDPFPLVVLDAASIGIPIICFDKAGGAPEIVESDAGIIVPYMDVTAMANALISLIKDVALREKMGQRAHEKAENYDISLGGMRILNIINNVMIKTSQEHAK